jgi:membrane-associated phospholipid phosphatase
MGFYLMVPAFLLYRRHGLLARACILLGLLAGLALGVTRVLQGAHFPSDVLWSAGFVYLTGLGLAGLFRLRIPGEASPVSERDAVRLRVAPDVTGSPEEISVPDIAEERETTRRDAA